MVDTASGATRQENGLRRLSADTTAGAVAVFHATGPRAAGRPAGASRAHGSAGTGAALATWTAIRGGDAAVPHRRAAAFRDGRSAGAARSAFGRRARTAGGKRSAGTR
jgi:hypothetical protein